MTSEILRHIRLERTARPTGPFGMKLSVGNRKVGNNTLTLNMGSATFCPSDALGLCQVQQRFGKNRACFSKNAEHYQHVLPRRIEQEIYWRNTSASMMIADLEAIFIRLPTMAERIKFFRFNEAGDFWGQECIEKANEISLYLVRLGIVTYVNSARSDLNFSGVSFFLRGSGWKGPSGETRVIASWEDVPKGFHLCPADCRSCHMCRIPFSNIAYRYHTLGRKPQKST